MCYACAWIIFQGQAINIKPFVPDPSSRQFHGCSSGFAMGWWGALYKDSCGKASAQRCKSTSGTEASWAGSSSCCWQGYRGYACSGIERMSQAAASHTPCMHVPPALQHLLCAHASRRLPPRPPGLASQSAWKVSPRPWPEGAPPPARSDSELQGLSMDPTGVASAPLRDREAWAVSPKDLEVRGLHCCLICTCSASVISLWHWVGGAAVKHDNMRARGCMCACMCTCGCLQRHMCSNCTLCHTRVCHVRL